MTVLTYLQSLSDIIRADEPAPRKRTSCAACGGTEPGGGCDCRAGEPEDYPMEDE